MCGGLRILSRLDSRWCRGGETGRLVTEGAEVTTEERKEVEDWERKAEEEREHMAEEGRVQDAQAIW